jgi:multicomponent Na+:H+ antiporter subunit G
MSMLLDAISWACLIGGAFFCAVGGIGLLRMPDFYTRIHAASVTETLGIGLLLAGLIVQAGTTLIALKLVALGLLAFFASPTATHALASAALTRGLAPQLAPSKEAPSKP